MSRAIRRSALPLAAALLVIACSSDAAIPAAADPDGITVEAEPDEVVLRLGSYNVAENLERFVRGPDLVIYGDGSVLRDTARLGDDTPTRYQQGTIERDRLIDIVAASRALPNTVDTAGCGDDEDETDLVVETRTWSACGLLDAPEFDTFVDAVHDEVGSLDLSEWVPATVVARASVNGPCAVLPASTLPVAFTAPVYPHAADRFPLGDFECGWD